MAADPVTAIATLLSEIFGFVVNPDGYAMLSREMKLRKLGEALDAALNARNYDAADRVYVELRKLYREVGP